MKLFGFLPGDRKGEAKRRAPLRCKGFPLRGRFPRRGRDALSKRAGGTFAAKAGSKLRLRPGNVREADKRGEEAVSRRIHLAVPEKYFGLMLFLAFFDRCGKPRLASSAPGGASLAFPREADDG